ncbi:MAG TPA: hypothetical protein VE152_12125 [Acidimicrobiales bacterium]|jgi:hypothetical protein|nr:hypothetical protein [Acidimicrobiales bacterium]
MLDHVLLDVIAAIRRTFEAALLERQAVEERFQIDVFLGDVSWETSYSLPGEGSPPRVRTDISLDWPTWSQTAYRSWSIGEPPDDLPELVVEVALRIQRLAVAPDPGRVLAVLPQESPMLGGDVLVRSGPTVEQVYERSMEVPQCAVEVSYEGTYRLDEAVLEHPAGLDHHVAALARWVASTLVRLGDLELSFLPPDDEEVGRP